MAKHRGAFVEIPGAGTPSEQANVEKIKLLYEVNGWTYVQRLNPINAGPRMVFTKPESAPDKVPFAQPHLDIISE